MVGVALTHSLQKHLFFIHKKRAKGLYSFEL
jgi:hypothetical protein